MTTDAVETTETARNIRVTRASNVTKDSAHEMALDEDPLGDEVPPEGTHLEGDRDLQAPHLLALVAHKDLQAWAHRHPSKVR